MKEASTAVSRQSKQTVRVFFNTYIRICIYIYCTCLWKEGIIWYQKLLEVSSWSYFCPGNVSVSIFNSVERNPSLMQLHLKN